MGLIKLQTVSKVAPIFAKELCVLKDFWPHLVKMQFTFSPISSVSKRLCYRKWPLKWAKQRNCQFGPNMDQQDT